MKVANDYVLSQLSSEKLSDESCKRLNVLSQLSSEKLSYERCKHLSQNKTG